MMGQCMLFTRYRWVPDSALHFDLVRDALVGSWPCRAAPVQAMLVAGIGANVLSVRMCVYVCPSLWQLESGKEGISHEQVDNVRSFYEQYVETLYSRNLISKDDRRTYKEVFPLFDPNYVYAAISTQPTLPAVVQPLTHPAHCYCCCVHSLLQIL